MVNIREIAFRPLRPFDLPLMNKLMRTGYWGYKKEALDRFMSSHRVDDASYFEDAFGFIVGDSRGIIGYYSFKIEEKPVLLDLFFLDVARIGKGYGRLLWEHCISQAKKKGWTEFIFWSDPHSQSFYECMGAVVIDQRPMVILPGHMAPIMKYEINFGEQENRSGKDE